MSTPPQDPAGDARTPRFEDPTRNIRLPSMPDRAPSVVRPEWQAHVPPAVADPASPPAPAEQPRIGTGDASDGTAAVAATRFPEPAPSRPYVLPNEPTDEMSSPPRVRQHTVAFDTPAGAPGAPHVPASHAPGQAAPQFGAPPFGPPSGAPGHGAPSYGPPPSYGPSGRGVEPGRSRRWPWVVLTVLPLLVIVVSGLLLLFLLRGA